MKKARVYLFTLGFLLLAGCGFHLRRASSIPPALHNMALIAEDENDAFAVYLKQQLLALDVSLKDQRTPLILKLSPARFTHTQPNVSTSNYAVTYTYTLSVNVTLIGRKGKRILASRTFSTSEDQMLNANQIYTSSTGDIVRQGLQRNLASLIFQWLTSKNTLAKVSSSVTTHPRRTPGRQLRGDLR